MDLFLSNVGSYLIIIQLGIVNSDVMWSNESVVEYILATRNMQFIISMMMGPKLSLLMIQLVIARSTAFHVLEATISTHLWMRRHGGRSVGIRRSLSSNNDDGSTETDGDKLAEFRNKNNIRDQVFSAMSADGSIKVTVCTARNLVNDLMIMHTLTATPSDALGRAVTCALMMSNGMQEEQVVQLTLNSKKILSGLLLN